MNNKLACELNSEASGAKLTSYVAHQNQGSTKQVWALYDHISYGWNGHRISLVFA